MGSKMGGIKDGELLEKLAGTRVDEIITQMEKLYGEIAEKQSVWYRESGFSCPEACGECCRNFEPDLLDCEAYYMAVWLLKNQPELADEVAKGNFPFPKNKGCPFWNEESKYHCSIYGGRPFICRFFGAYGAKAKNGEEVFKPCKFYPAEILAEHKPPLAHRQYSASEVKMIFGVLPPLSTDIMEKALALNPDNRETRMLREVLPEAVNHVKWICSLADGKTENN
jgi:Fe-S-cluster containining protein